MVVGSPKGRESASHSIADYLVRKLARYQAITEIIHVNGPMLPTETLERYHTLMDAADAVVLVFPLYADQIPSGLVKYMEEYTLHCFRVGPTHPQSLTAVVNNGFPEAHQNDLAVEVARRFAETLDFGWLGGLTLGGGGMIPAEGDLEKAGGRVIPVVKALDALVLCLAQEGAIPIPDYILERVRKPIVPNWLYRFMADWSFRSQARHNGIRKQLKNQPYLEESSQILSNN